MFKWLLPKECSFFDYFEKSIALSVDACRELDTLAANPLELSSRANAIKELERQADNTAHQCIDALHRTFITPFDRAEIHRLIQRLDDIIDSVDAAASRMELYELTEARPELKQFTAVLLKATTEIAAAIHSLTCREKVAAENAERAGKIARQCLTLCHNMLHCK
jgi:uncharacterized protein Yka (UPF0111/DUF47 family)